MRLKPATQISLGLMLLTVSILFAGDMLGVTPNVHRAELDARKKFSEALAIQFSTAASKRDNSYIRTTLKAVVDRNDDVRGAAFRLVDGETIAEAGEQAGFGDWNAKEKSSPNRVFVPIFSRGERWGTVAVQFAKLNATSWRDFTQNSFAGLVLFVAALGFMGYWLFMRRALRELDPSGVVPERVKAAFDALAEGVLIIDEHGIIVLANAVFARELQRPVDKLVGFKAAELNWFNPETEQRIAEEDIPWSRVLQQSGNLSGERIVYAQGTPNQRTFMVNSAPIQDGKDNPRGVLATFDDVTDLEEKNKRLRDALAREKEAKHEINFKNKELHVLATRDPLTDCLNRRALNEQFDELFAEAQKNDTELACIMVDIDHFKSVNDRFGHTVGDEIIKIVAETLKSKVRKMDSVGRYGGEEFCLLLPDIGIEFAELIAQRIRRAIRDGRSSKHLNGDKLTASLGISSTRHDVGNKEELLSQADKALYASKQQGRNRVTLWTTELDSLDLFAAANDAADAAAKPQSAAGTDEDTSVVKPSSSLERLQIRIQELEGVAEDRKQQLVQQRSQDALTGLPARDLFYDRIDVAIATARRADKSAAVLSLGIRNFAQIRDTLGHAAVDELLLHASRRLTSALRITDAVTSLTNQDSGEAANDATLDES
ncbi:MAG: diguanylate cyclase, partial [Pseudomonadales bacterium]